MIKKILKSTINIAILLLLMLATPHLSTLLHDAYLYDYKGSSVTKLTYTNSDKSGGSGFQVLAPSGKQYTLTNGHICDMQDSNSQIRAHFNGESRKIRVIKKYNRHDLCILESIPELKPISVSDSVYLHSKVHLIGYPKLMPLSLQSGFLAGNHDLKLYMLTDPKVPCYTDQTYIPYRAKVIIGAVLKHTKKRYCYNTYKAHYINVVAYPGNSGSPVLNNFGRLVGVLFAGTPGANTISFIVPLKYIQSFLKTK